MKTTAPALCLVLLLGCSTPTGTGSGQAAGAITAEGIMNHIRVLASDEFEGRLPGGKGEELSVHYITEQFKALGLQPGNPNGSYVQNVPLAGYRSDSQVYFQAGGKRISSKPGADYVAASRRMVPEVSVQDSEMVFVGYGVVAPEYGWDDYKGLDVKGKTLIMLINDPAVPDPSAPGKLDPNFFKGRAMTYYGRWTYKYEIATEKGAAAAVIVHETVPASYPWEVVRNSWGGENFDIQKPDRNMGRVAVESWITVEKAQELIKAAGRTFDDLKKAATRKDFKPVPLNAKATFKVRNTIREIQSRNVIAKLEGAEQPGEYVIYTSHWDHLGRDESIEGDQILNGALDNASGVSCLIEIARAFTKVPRKSRRTILFNAVTAEEQGLLGAKYYVENPLYPLNKTLANVNMDGINPWGRTNDITVIGFGNSTLEDIAAGIAQEGNRTVQPDAEPEKGSYYRADHFEFAKKGVPAFYSASGTEYIGKPAGFAEEKRKEFTAKHYHKPSDEIDPSWDLSGAVEDTRLLFELGYRVAQADKWPQWKAGTEFKATREAMLR